MQGWCIEHSEGGCRWRTLWGNTAFPQGVMLELSCGKTEPGGSFHSSLGRECFLLERATSASSVLVHEDCSST